MYLTRASVAEIRVFCLGGVGFKTSCLRYVVGAVAVQWLLLHSEKQIPKTTLPPGAPRTEAHGRLANTGRAITDMTAFLA